MAKTPERKPFYTATTSRIVPPPPPHSSQADILASTRPTAALPQVKTERIAPTRSTYSSASAPTERLRAEPYSNLLPYQAPLRPTPSVQRFAPGRAVAWFHAVAHKVDLLIRPSFAVTVMLLNLVLMSCWAVVQLGAELLPHDTRNRVRRLRAPEVQPGHPLTAVVFFGMLLFLFGGVAKPMAWQSYNLQGWGITARPWATDGSDPSKANTFWSKISRAMTGPAPAVEINIATTSVRAAGDHNVQGAASISAEQVDAILASYGSPANGSGAAWVAMGQKYNIDPAYAVAFFIHESSAGTNPAWAGIKADGSTTHNVGNIICAGYDTCYGRFRDYPSWDAGIEDWYRLIAVEYIEGRGTLTVDEIVPIYAPSFENDVAAYVNSVNGMVDQWRTNGVQ